jgi:hypothetical protein
LNDLSHYPWIEHVLLDNDLGGERLGGIVRKNGYACLRDDGAGIDTRIHEVHGTTMLMMFRLNRARVRVEPREMRKERGVNIDEPSVKSCHEFRLNDDHKTGKGHKMRVRGLYRAEDGSLEFGKGGVLLASDYRGRNVGVSRYGEPTGIPLVSDNVVNSIPALLLNQRLKVRTSAR